MSISVDATITSKGQVTIPKEIRDRLGLEAGQVVEFVLGEDGTVEVRPKKPAVERLAEVKETIAARSPDVDLDEIRRESERAWGPVDRGDR